MPVTAKVVVHSHPTITDEQTTVQLQADYADGINKEWAAYTPSIYISMAIKNSLVEQFPVGRKFTLRFDEA